MPHSQTAFSRLQTLEVSFYVRFTMGVNPFHKEYFYSYDSSRAMRFKENLIADRRILHASFKRVNLPFHYIMT